ncbi:MAG: NYN domain-containing protein, partial [Dehalococcoidia bacterium]|nr:NYN domain-containing protein [Dehalococcoidia bacterium]
DTDLIPALEFVAHRRALGVSVEVAAWKDHKNERLDVAGEHVWCHYLSRSDYEQVRDKTVYVSTS